MRIMRRMGARFGSICRCGTHIRIGDIIGYYRENGRGHAMCSGCFETWEKKSCTSKYDGDIYVQEEIAAST